MNYHPVIGKAYNLFLWNTGISAICGILIRPLENIYVIYMEYLSVTCHIYNEIIILKAR